MPLYEYECVKCGRRTEKIESVAGPYLKKCPHCGGKVESVLTAPAIQFKGSGWYVTDYAGKSGKVDSGQPKNSDGATSESKNSTATDGASQDTKDSKHSQEPKESKESKEKKTAKKK